MPTTKERLNLYLSDDLASVIRRASVVRGVSRAQVVTDLMDSIQPQLTRMVELLEVAQQAPAAVSADLKRALDNAYDELEPIANQSAELFDTLGTNIKAAVTVAVDQTKRDLAA